MPFTILILACSFGLMGQEKGVVVAQPAFRKTVLTGFTRPRASMPLTVEVSGKCEAVMVDVGDTVGENGIFARLDGTFTALEREGNRLEQQRLDSRIAFLAKEVQRFANLLEKRTISQANYDEIAQQLDQARLEKAGLTVREKFLTEQLRRFEVTAPAGWTVEERLVEPGQWMNTGSVLGTVGDYRTLEVPFALDAQQLRQLMTLDDGLGVVLPDEGSRVPATVAHISPAFDETTRKTSVTLALSPDGLALRGGMRVTLTLELAAQAGVVVLPSQALEHRYDTYWLTRENGERLRVQLREENDDGTVHLAHEALQPGDRFLVTPSRAP